MPFQNPIVGGTALVRTAINSPNFVAGSTGWSINRDGTAEFASAVLRGEVDVGPGSPNPRIVITKNIPATLAAGSADFTWSAAKLMYFDANTYVWEAIGTFVGTGGPFPLYGKGTYDTTHGVVYNEFEQGPGSPSVLVLLYGSDTYNSHALSWLYRNGTVDFTPTSTVIMEGTALAKSVQYLQGTTPELWQPLAGLYNAGWADFGGGFVDGQYRRVASPPNAVQIIGVLSTTAPTTNIATLPVNYRPVSRQRVPCYAFGAGMSIVAETPAFDVTTGGVLVPLATAGATVLAFNNLFQLDV